MASKACFCRSPFDGRCSLIRQKKAAKAAFFCALNRLLHAGAVFVGARVDFDLVANFNKGWNREFEAGCQACRFHHFT